MCGLNAPDCYAILFSVYISTSRFAQHIKDLLSLPLKLLNSLLSLNKDITKLAEYNSSGRMSISILVIDQRYSKAGILFSF